MLLGVDLFEYVWTEGIFSKYHIKIRSKSKQEGEQNNLKNMNWTTRQLSQIYKISVWMHIEILNSFITGGMPLCRQVTHWDLSPHEKLQQITTRCFEPTSLAAILLDSTFNFFSNMTYLRLIQSQVSWIIQLNMRKPQTKQKFTCCDSSDQ